MMNVKVCGITTLKQLEQLDGLNVDYAGMIFAKESPRYAGAKLDPDEVKRADLDIQRVGVFVNEEYKRILAISRAFGLDLIQLHGDEDPAFCERLTDEGLEVIKVFRLNDDEVTIEELIEDYDDVCDYYLFDAGAAKQKGGTGKKFNWDKLKDKKIEKPFFLSGGIGPGDAAAIKKLKHPDLFGVDLNSLFEKEPGVKDMGVVLKFIHDLK